jgi:hypothetical protein
MPSSHADCCTPTSGRIASHWRQRSIDISMPTQLQDADSDAQHQNGDTSRPVPETQGAGWQGRHDRGRRLTASRELCPERCAEVERALNKSNEFQGVIHYERIFQSIVRRHPDVLRHVSIEYLELNTNRGLDGEILTIITAQSIMSISSDGRIDQQPWNPHVRCIDPSFHHRDEVDNNREG